MLSNTKFSNFILTNNTGEDVAAEWLLMSSPMPILAIIIAYLGFVLIIGPVFMRNRPPFDLKIILVVYNVLQVFISILVFYVTTEHVLQNGLIIRQERITENKEFKIKTASIIYYYFLAKTSELFDTVFFVLRKRDRQLSFLHIYHHTFTVIFSWCTTRFNPAYIFIFIGTLNSFVHIIMYAYYGLAAFPNLTKYLWWKKYITKMQLVQFFLMVLHLLLTPQLSSRSPSNPFVVALVFNNLLFVYLFSIFYVKEYLNRQPVPTVNKSTPDVINSNNINHHKVSDKMKLL